MKKIEKIDVKKLDEIDEDEKKRMVLEVMGEKKKIVNGVMYKLKLRVV